MTQAMHDLGMLLCGTGIGLAIGIWLMIDIADAWGIKL